MIAEALQFCGNGAAEISKADHTENAVGVFRHGFAPILSCLGLLYFGRWKLFSSVDETASKKLSLKHEYVTLCPSGPKRRDIGSAGGNRQA